MKGDILATLHPPIPLPPHRAIGHAEKPEGIPGYINENAGGEWRGAVHVLPFLSEVRLTLPFVPPHNLASWPSPRPVPLKQSQAVNRPCARTQGFEAVFPDREDPQREN